MSIKIMLQQHILVTGIRLSEILKTPELVDVKNKAIQTGVRGNWQIVTVLHVTSCRPITTFGRFNKYWGIAMCEPQ